MALLDQIKPKSFITDFVHLIYPSSCLVCENELAKSEKHICSICDNSLIRTSFHLYSEPTETDKLFWGRVQLQRTYSHFYFKKDTPIQNLLFNLKYKNNPAIGDYFGAEIGKSLLDTSDFKSADAILPVPLHYKKEFIRGYNQSLALSNGISKTLGVEVKTNLVKRTAHTDSQTKKSRFQRWDNVNSIFSVHQSLTDLKHVIIVDDVVTTGSTIEAMVKAIKSTAPEVKVSIITLAIA